MKNMAAVMIPVIEKDDGNHILFEKRALHLTHQPGDICFPGGGVEPGENAADAVVRECCEELLISPEDITDLREFKTMPGPKGSREVCIFIGKIQKYLGTFSKDEVDITFTVPIDWFYENPADDSVYYPTYNYKCYTIWGFTARALKEYLEAVSYE